MKCCFCGLKYAKTLLPGKHMAHRDCFLMEYPSSGKDGLDTELISGLRKEVRKLRRRLAK
jgi:hypothetical protein